MRRSCKRTFPWVKVSSNWASGEQVGQVGPVGPVGPVGQAGKWGSEAQVGQVRPLRHKWGKLGLGQVA